MVLDHQSWVSGGNNRGIAITGHIVENKSDTFFPSFSSSTARASTSSVSGTVNTNIYTQGSHGYSVNNTSGTYQTYTVDIKLCADSTYCFYDRSHIGVEKGGYFSSSATSYLTCMFSYVGDYSLEATTSISGDTSASDVGRATIYVRR